MLRSTLKDTALMFHLPYTEIEQNTPVYSGSIGLINLPSDNLKLSLLFSTGYRVPNVDDLTKIFDSKKGIVIVPNPNLKPEKTVNYEMGITKIFGAKSRWENSVYYTDFTDIAVVDTFRLNGKDSIMYNGTLSRVYANQNRNKAYIYGFSSNLFSKLDENFSFSLALNYTYGRIKTDSIDIPLDHIPPFVVRGGLNYNYNKFGSEFFILYNGWKRASDYGGGEDNIQYATSEGMPAWFTLNLRMSYKMMKQIMLQAGVDNILDTQYRTFASGINAPGRNFMVAVRGRF
jgi:hemoglobin/transferrin/lactoferrin receptor protein